MEQVRACAELSIRRGLAFAGLAIFCVMMSLSYDPALALKSAAILTTLVTTTLAYRGWTAPQRPYRQTEVWILLDKPKTLSERELQEAIGQTLRSCYLLHAELAAALTLALWIMSFVAWILLPAPVAVWAGRTSGQL